MDASIDGSRKQRLTAAFQCVITASAAASWRFARNETDSADRPRRAYQNWRATGGRPSGAGHCVGCVGVRRRRRLGRPQPRLRAK
eukprot:3741624-Prymnesium_polylepis.1